MNKRIKLLQNLILAAFIALAFFVAGIVICGIGLIGDYGIVDDSVFTILIFVFYLLSLGLVGLIFRMFDNRASLFRRQTWITTMFDYDADIWGEDTFERKAQKRMSKADEGQLEMTGVICIHGFSNQPMSSFRQVDIYELNNIIFNAIKEEIDDNDKWLYGISRDNKYLFYAQVSNQEEFFGFLQNIVRKINKVIGDKPSLPMAFIMIGGNVVTDKETIYEAVEHANIAAKYDANMRLSGDVSLFNESMANTKDFEKEKSVELDQALEKKQFLIYYQAKWNVKEERYYGAEALIRWRHPRRGYLPPSSFIPYAEASGKIINIDHYVFETVCQDLARWKKEKKRSIVVSVNLSRRTIYDPGLIDFFAETIKKYGVDPKNIEIELTESLAAQDSAFISFVIKKIKKLGFSTSIDDFGIGYSSLSAIKSIDFDVLKLDKSFIDDVELDKTSENLVASIISLVHGLGMFVIAEGIESPNQVAILKKHDLDAVQGYFYAKPLEVTEFEALLEHNKFEEEAKAKQERKSKRKSKKGGDEE